ncbi:MAG: alpha-ketoacid dehydrogenase subunit beta [Planctomycetota bacterium]|nr:alpha-ketoacid dehydrogenase subunit beta [Planctomycetota bacterium]
MKTIGDAASAAWTVLTDAGRGKPAVEMRKAFMTAVNAAMDRNERVVMLEADLGGASGSRAVVGKQHPERYFDVGIAEANMVGMAAGLSMLGFVPFLHSFAPFLSRRVADQLYLEGAYARTTMILYASDPGVCAAQNGGTHSTYEDVALVRAIPGVNVFHPADAVQMTWLVSELAGRRGVHYLRANRKLNPDIYSEGSRFEIGRGNVLRRGGDILLVAAGDMLPEALEAAEILAKDGLAATVLDMFTLKPFDAELLLKAAEGKRVVVTMENHSIYGGLGGIVAELLAEAGCRVPLRRIGIRDRFGQVGDVMFLKKSYGLTVADTLEAIKGFF